MSKTDIGLRRERNEDSYLVDDALGLYAVADGMGGHRGGEIASALAVQVLRECFLRQSSDRRSTDPKAIFTEAYRECSRRIFERSKENHNEFQGMGTTLVSAFVHGDNLCIANVGDSRAYLFSQNQLWQLTDDHSLVNEQLRAGIITPLEAETFAAKNVITRSVGFEPNVECDVIEKSMQPGDVFLLCSDGYSGLVEDKKTVEIMADFNNPKIVEKLIAAAHAGGGDDNITVMLIIATH